MDLFLVFAWHATWKNAQNFVKMVKNWNQLVYNKYLGFKLWKVAWWRLSFVIQAILAKVAWFWTIIFRFVANKLSWFDAKCTVSELFLLLLSRYVLHFNPLLSNPNCLHWQSKMFSFNYFKSAITMCDRGHTLGILGGKKNLQELRVHESVMCLI